ncbi:GNAT family N-acetyltransferase [uncultured Rhodoblastus sp.]|uniref:GNAT family N-acetyltransferase n=1 Tax=uncultured Rhodoblastus sp. TaxID=543037 RepID=UPI0025F06753|nr:GNAT family N-acetyltransferase [uncultured Rhodoblastus sp.]
MVQKQQFALRPALPADTSALAELFRASIEELAQEDYNPAQIDAWAGVADDEQAFAKKLAGGLTIVALRAHEIVGFASLKGVDVLDMLYVHPNAARKGVATQLCDALEKLAAARKTILLKADAADCATGFFALRGYEPIQRNMVFLGDEVLGNTTMTKRLAAETGQTQ